MSQLGHYIFPCLLLESIEMIKTLCKHFCSWYVIYIYINVCSQYIFYKELLYLCLWTNILTWAFFLHVNDNKDNKRRIYETKIIMISKLLTVQFDTRVLFKGVGDTAPPPTSQLRASEELPFKCSLLENWRTFFSFFNFCCKAKNFLFESSELEIENTFF